MGMNELEKYIKEGLKKKVPLDGIRDVLTHAGWESHEIEKAIYHVKKSHNPRFISLSFLIIGALMVIGSVIYWIFW